MFISPIDVSNPLRVTILIYNDCTLYGRTIFIMSLYTMWHFHIVYYVGSMMKKHRAASHLVTISRAHWFPPMRLLEWPKFGLWAFTLVPKLWRLSSYMAALLGCFGAKEMDSWARVGLTEVADSTLNRESIFFLIKIIK